MLIELPAELQNDEETIEIIKVAVQQFGKLAAWSWSEVTVVKNSKVISDSKDEEDLKKLFRATLQNQAKFRMAYINYGDDNSYNQAKAYSDSIKKLFLENDKLHAVIKTLCGNEPIFKTEPELFSQFRYEVIVDQFSGFIKRNDNQSAATPEKYISVLAYPPRPELGEYTFTNDQLESWVLGTITDYLPPSPYIPIGAF